MNISKAAVKTRVSKSNILEVGQLSQGTQSFALSSRDEFSKENVLHCRGLPSNVRLVESVLSKKFPSINLC